MTPTIAKEQDLDISIDRVDKIDAPLLVIGLGGTGKDAVKVVKKTLAQRYNLETDASGRTIPAPKNTAYLVLDSDTKNTDSSHGLAEHEFMNLTCDGLNNILNPSHPSTEPWERNWLNPNLNAASSGLGAGTYRQAARFMLGRKYDTVVSRITNKLTSSCTVIQGNIVKNKRINVVLISGLSGGTGSGTFLDLAQIIRHILGNTPSLNGFSFKLNAYLMMPDISAAVLPAGHALHDTFRKNAFAALKELDFWMGYGTKHTTPYVMQYTHADASRIQWGKPFDYCTLMSGVTFTGTAFKNPNEVVFNTIAETLLHYLANEAPPEDGTTPYSYISYEDNLAAAVAALSKPYPVNYAYRTIGAYTKKIPKRKMIYYEGAKLFTTFMPVRDNTTHVLVRDTQLITKGQATNDMNQVVHEYPALYKIFSTHAKLPSFCNRSADDLTITNMRQMIPKPHDQEDCGAQPWLTSSLNPNAIGCANTFLEDAWMRFQSFATNILADPKKGPFALLSYLANENNTFYRALSEQTTNWKNTYEQLQGSIASSKAACKNSWQQFLAPPFMQKARAINTYLENLDNYYETHRRTVFLEKYSDALGKLQLRVAAYRDQALKPLCDSLDTLEKTFHEHHSGDAETHDELFSLQSVQASIDTSFDQAMEDDHLTRKFLDRLATASFTNKSNVSVGEADLRFTFSENGLAKIRQSLRDELDTCFVAINHNNLDALVEEKYPGDVTNQQREMGQLLTAMQQSADPLFSVDAARAGTPKVCYSYLSVPENAPLHFAHYATHAVVKPKKSSLLDHIYCLTTYDGMPLFLYSQMQVLQASYDAALQYPELNKGFHLVWKGDRNAPVSENWTKLPSPAPVHLFQAGNCALNSVMETIHRAVACGMLTIDDAQKAPSYSLRIQYTDTPIPVAKSSQVIRAEVDKIDQTLDPATNQPLTEASRLPLFQDYRNHIRKTSHDTACNATCMQAYLGLTSAYCDPWDEAIQATPNLLDEANTNHKKLCEALVAACIYTNPYVYAFIEDQLEGMEYLQSRIDHISRIQNTWETRIAFANTVADLFVFGLVRISYGTAVYVIDGKQKALCAEELQKPDIGTLENYTRCAAYLADLPKENPLLDDLLHLLTAKKNALEEMIISGEIAQPEGQALIAGYCAQAQTLLDAISEETSEYKEQSRMRGADQNLLANIASLHAAITRTVAEHLRNLR